MTVPDLNRLLYAHDKCSIRHADARLWWAALLQGNEPIGMPCVAATGFIKLMSSSALINPPLPPLAAGDSVRDWLGHGHISPLNPTDNHLAFLFPYPDIPGIRPNLVTDAHIAALVMEHDATARTANSDFRGFPPLRWSNQLA